MASARSHRVRVSQLLRLIAFLGLTAVHARADLRLVPAADGHVGVFLVLGPLGPATHALDPANLEVHYGRGARAGVPGSWRLGHSGATALDLAKLLRTEQRGTRALVAGVLELPEALAGLLLLSADGSVSVSVDGQAKWTRVGHGFRGQAWDTIPLDLAPGRHQVVVELEHPGIHWGFEMRWLDRNTLRPPKHARWLTEGTPPVFESLVARGLIAANIEANVDARGFTPTITLDHPRGILASDELESNVRVHFIDGTTREHRLGALALTEHGIQTLRATLPALHGPQLGRGTHELDFEVDVGRQRVRLNLAVSQTAAKLAEMAEAALVKLESEAGLSDQVREVLAATVEFHLRALEQASATGHAHLLNQAADELARLLDQLARDPEFLFSPGVHALAHRSALDGGLQSFWLHVPLGFDRKSERKYPAVLALHGYNGSPQGILQAFVDNKSLQARAGVDGFVIAPEAHGNAFYRGPGEFEAMAVLALVKQMVPLDPDRTSVTGVSMGGTGAAQLALRYQDTFSAAAPLCGYHSYFIRRDTQDRPLRPWEVARMHHWSTSSWADNGRYLPLFVAHGLKDHPLANSKVLIQAYGERGYSVAQEWPDIGHAVWTISYQGARLWPWLSQRSRPTAPDHVTIVTDALRFGQRYWAELLQFERYGAQAKLDVERSSPTTVQVTTKNVQRFRLTPAASPGATRLEVKIDRETLSVPIRPALDFYRTDRWSLGNPSGTAGEKRAGIEGPIRDVFLGPVAFVYGSLRANTWRANREIAERFGRYHQGVTLEYPVLADSEVSAELVQTHSLVLVGTAEDHSILKRLKGRLPIEPVAGGIRAGGKTYVGQDVGAIFIHPNPEAPARYVVVITAPSVGGMFRSLSLPQLLPDFVVYDIHLRDAASQQVLGSARVRAAGFFERDWSWPSKVVDEVEPQARLAP